MANISISRISIAVVLGIHAIAATAWLYFMPGGFPIPHLRFFANRAIPLIVLLIVARGCYALQVGNTRVLQAVLASIASGWVVAAITGIALFPISTRLICLVAILIGARISVTAIAVGQRKDLLRPLPLFLALLGAAIGFVSPLAQRAELPTTHPLDIASPPSQRENATSAPGMLRLSKSMLVAPSNGAVTIQHRKRYITIEPLLTFISLSPDRCWSAFAPIDTRTPPPRKLLSWNQTGTTLETVYSDIGTSTLSVRADGEDFIELAATCQITEAVYSHLNTFCEISLTGHSKLSLQFSPCPGQRIDVLPMDYPRGRPARLAYMDASDVFHVVEASSGEKGPYRTLTSGNLIRTQPLEITLFDHDTPILSVVFMDWAAQASTSLSPTAGWGVAQNAIEFSLQDDALHSMGSLFISLASTSPGRGFDTVGHGPGTYQNHMKIRLLSPETDPVNGRQK